MIEDHCSIFDLGEVFVNPYVSNSCDEEQYKAIYEGQAIITISNKGEFLSVLVETNDAAFDLLVKQSERVCGRLLHRTEVPNLVLDLNSQGTFMRPVEKVRTEELHLFSYINAKFVYFDKRIGENLGSIEKTFSLKRCQHELETIKNCAAFATIDPDLFAYIMNDNRPGMTGKLSGEMVHLIKCVEKSVTRRNTSDLCFEEIPVDYEGKEYFITPRNRLLIPNGSPTPCNENFPACYVFGDNWRTLYSDRECPTPEKITLNINESKWSYSYSKHLSTAGIYTQAAQEAYQQSLVLAAETRARQHALESRYYGKSTYTAGGSGINLMDSFDVKSLGNQIWGSVKGFAAIVGETVAIVLGFVAIAMSATQIISFSVKSWALIKVHGCSLQGLMGLIPGGELLLWAKKKLTTQTDFDRMKNMSKKELAALYVIMKEAHLCVQAEGQNVLYPDLPP